MTEAARSAPPGPWRAASASCEIDANDRALGGEARQARKPAWRQLTLRGRFRARNRLWSIPVIYTMAAIGAGLVLPRAEQAWLGAYVHPMPASVAAEVFSAVASGTISFTGVAFTVAFVVLQVASNSYSPRLAADLASRPALYHTLGLFFATLTYALVAMSWTGRGGASATPLLSTYLVGVLLFASLLAFARLIQSVTDLGLSNIVRMVGRRGRAVIETRMPVQSAGDPDPSPRIGPVTQTIVFAGEPCVVADIDARRFFKVAEREEAVLVLECGVGDAVVDDTVLLRVHGGVVSETEVRSALRLRARRTFDRDPKYAIRVLVDIAIRALSPAVNDPTTAVQAIDEIEDLLLRIGRRPLDTGCLRGPDGRPRVLYPAPTWDDYLALALAEISQYGAGSIQVERRLRALLASLADKIRDPHRRAAVLRCLAGLDSARGRAGGAPADRQGLGLSRSLPPPAVNDPTANYE